MNGSFENVCLNHFPISNIVFLIRIYKFFDCDTDSVAAGMYSQPNQNYVQRLII